MSTSSNTDATDLDRIHAAAKREKADVEPLRQPAPVWVMFLGMIVAIIGGGQLGVMTGGFKFETSNPFAMMRSPDPRPMLEGEGAALDPFAKAMKGGAGSYAVCGGCHQGNGMGLPGLFPPLAGSEWVTGGTERLIRVVLHGLMGPINVKGSTYNGAMPAQGAMSDTDLANALTFVRNSWGNEAPMVTKEMVKKVRDEVAGRTTPWSESELVEYADKNVEGLIPAGPGASAAEGE